MINKFVAGNDIFISWRILKNQDTNFDFPSVVLYDSFKKKCPLTYEIEDKGTELLVTGKYLGKDQKTFGLYHLVFYNNYNEEDMNTLVYRNAFVLIHSAKRGLTTYGDEDADQSVLVELESDLSVALMNQEITDREEIIQALSDMTLVNDSQNQLLNDISTHLDSSISDLMNRIENISVGDFSQLIGEIEDNEEAITRYLSIIDNSVYLHKMQLFDNSTLIGEVSTRLLYLKNLHVTPLENNVTDISTKLTDLSTYIDNFNPGSDYDDSELTNTLNDLSTYTHNIVIPSEYDDSVLKGRIADISTYAINTSSRLNDLSTFAHNITPGSDYDDSELTNKINDLSTYTHNLVIPTEYDDSVLKNRIADVSSYSINVSSKLDEVSTFAHSITVSESYDDSAIQNRIADVSQYSINVSTSLVSANSSIADLSTRLYAVEQSGGGSGDQIHNYVLYTTKGMIPDSVINTSNFLFHDFIFDISINSEQRHQNYSFNVLDTENNVEYQIYKYMINWYVTGGNYGTSSQLLRHMSEDLGYEFGRQGHFFLYHFPFLMKYVSQNPSIYDVKDYIFFRLEN